jgi:hypothetical protein
MIDRFTARILFLLSFFADERYMPHVASVIWLCPSSVRSRSSIESLPHVGQTMLFSKVGRIALIAAGFFASETALVGGRSLRRAVESLTFTPELPG